MYHTSLREDPSKNRTLRENRMEEEKADGVGALALPPDDEQQQKEDEVCRQLSDLTDVPDIEIESPLDAYVPGALRRAVMEKWDRSAVGTLRVGDAAPNAPVCLLSGGGELVRQVDVLQCFRHPGRLLVLNFGSYRFFLTKNPPPFSCGGVVTHFCWIFFLIYDPTS